MGTELPGGLPTQALGTVGRGANKALTALIKILALPQTVALPVWGGLVQVRVDASEMGVGYPLTWDTRGAELVFD